MSARGIRAALALGLVLAAAPALAAEQTVPPPYSCRLYYDEQKKCAFGSCDQRTLDRLKKEWGSRS
jgi:hypothetical protein